MANISNQRSLQDLLAESLPKDVAFTFYHYSTPPSKSPALFSAPPHRKPQRTYCESHFLAAAITPRDSAALKSNGETLVLAIEVLIYSTKDLTTLFVSKADSTGYIASLKLPRSQSGSPLKTICGTFVSWLARERQREGKKLVVSLFARAQDQYLFPASIDNPDKHVLDDRGLVKWWCRVLDPLMQEYAPEEEKKTLTERLADGGKDTLTNGTSSKVKTTAKGYLVVPGFDTHETLRHLPPTTSPKGSRRWAAAHPLLDIAPHPGAPPRCLVPHFPDDPKSRYLDELDEELPDGRGDEMIQPGGTPSRSNGQWKSVKTLDQFWDMMAFRQECSSGRIVGFIWVVMTPPKLTIPEEAGESEPSQSQSQPQSQPQDAAHRTIEPLLPPPPSPTRKKLTPKKPRRRKVNTDFGPIPLLLPKIKSNGSNLSAMSGDSTNGSSRLPPESTRYFQWPNASRGSVVFSTTAYNRAHEILLQQNFATLSAAIKSTKRWKEEIAVLGGVDKWSWTVVGKRESVTQTDFIANGAAPVTLVGIRKKRKPDSSVTEEVDKVIAQNGVQVLGEGLVRKKAKTEDAAAMTDVSIANSVNELGAGLVRRKPKN
ncbi:histone acetylation protein-domain-containing protein [Dendryphion nanum]|uniref:histone acetyltransferase n=1 Tax=Dendryphion nanum TaxID=256645 RepID=A0A9P9EDG9_9PLEO|nr:histone acetylation protein-domain-containing protein [Dendryphion nanum]